MEEFSHFWVNQNYLNEIPRIFKGKYLVVTLREEKNAIMKGQSVPLYLPKSQLHIKLVKARWVVCILAVACVCKRILGALCMCTGGRTPLREAAVHGRCTHTGAEAAALEIESPAGIQPARAVWVPWGRVGVCAPFVQQSLCFHGGTWVASGVWRSSVLLRSLSLGQV